jgi:hypothetical protein
MKKQVALALGLAVISGSALASKARLEALGENADGSQYIMDARNIFLNPAQANYFKDMVTIEAGNTSNNDDKASSPNAEGGFLRASGNMVYGAFFGHEDQTLNDIRTSGVGTVNLADQNTWDFFIAGDAGVQWGANLSYMSYKDDQTSGAEVESDAVRVNVGIISGDTEAFLKTSLSETGEDKGTADIEVNSRYVLGLSHNIDGGTIIFNYSSFEAEESVTDKTWKDTTFNVGYGKVTKLNDSSSFNWKVNYMSEESENEDYLVASGDQKAYALSAVMGLESVVKEWLTLRASIGQNLLSEEENDAGKTRSTKDSTIVAAGASFVFGDFQVDGMIGNDAAATGSPGEDTSAGNGTLRTDSLLSRVSATYRF